MYYNDEDLKLKRSYDILKDAIDIYYKNLDVIGALAKITEALSIYPKAIFAYQLRADIFRNLNKIDEALQSLEEGLKMDPVNYFLLWKRAEILGFYKGRVQDAITDIQNAIAFFEQTSSKQNEQLVVLGDEKSRSEFLKNYTSNKIDLRIIQQTLFQLREVNLTNLRVNELEQKLKNERVRSIELLGIFTAVLGFIFATVQKMPKLHNFGDLLLFGLALVIPFILFLLLMRLLFSK